MTSTSRIVVVVLDPLMAPAQVRDAMAGLREVEGVVSVTRLDAFEPYQLARLAGVFEDAEDDSA